MRSTAASVIENSILAVRFIENLEPGDKFTVGNLATAMGLKNTRNAYKYFDSLSLHYPIALVDEYQRIGRGMKPAVYTIMEE